MLMDGQADGRTDGQKVITIAHPEHSSGGLKITGTLSGETTLKALLMSTHNVFLREVRKNISTSWMKIKCFTKSYDKN